ncbi:tetratricopeptide repeat protein [Arthrobacter sp. PM3]|uniref:tetratricopeptide repeat protein n=1 Tax=Arthrobacter sp. PM3 TaxID=2017685 RepID=UPI001ABF351F|nr:tetratricopeptide repeat protein [Arthrobacter sp. PM3]
MIEDLLLGGHKGIVADLHTRIKQIRDEAYDGANIILLRGPSGVGKSRIIRELYTALCADQNRVGPAYWGPLYHPGPTPESGASDPMQVRKELGPRPESFIWAPGALPNFGWWTLDCVRDSGGNALDVTRTLTAQLDAHALPLAIAHRRKSAWTEKAAGAWERVLGEVQSVAKDEAVGVLEDFLGQALNVALPGIGPLLGWGVKGVGAAKDRYQENQLLNREVTSGDLVAKAGRSRAEETARGLRSLSRPTLPGVVVIEDLHRMDASFANFLDAAAETDSRKPLLVIGTVWPEGFSNPAFSDWFKSRGVRVSELIEVPELLEDDLVRILLEYAPNTNVPDAHVIVERFGTPHFLKLWLTCRGTQKLIKKQQGALVVDETLMNDIPDDINDVMKERWKELPTEARQAIGLAVAAQPQGAERLPKFLPEIINSLRPPVELPEGRSIQEGMQFAIDPSAWCRLTQEVASLREESLHRIVREQLFSGPDRWDADEVESIRASAVDALVQWVVLNVPVDSWLTSLGPDPTPKNEERSAAAPSHAAAEWLIDLDPDGTTLAHGWAHLDLASQHRHVYAYPAAIAAMEKAMGVMRLRTGDQNEFLLALQELLANTYAESGNLAKAIEIQKRLPLEAAAILGPENLGSLVIRRSLADYLTDAGDLEAAYEQLRPLLDDHVRVLGPNHPHTLTTRAFLAECLAQRGRLKEAVEMFTTLLKDQIRILGKDHPNTLSTRGSLIEHSKVTADSDETKTELERLLADRTRVLGERHHSTLGTRRDLANALAAHGDLVGAVELGDC